MSAVPGWYPDPAGSENLRFYDGQTWTSHLAPAAPVVTAAQAPVMAPPMATTAYASLPARPGSQAVTFGGTWPPAPTRSDHGKAFRIGGGLLAGLVALLAWTALKDALPKSVYDRTSIQMPDQVAGLNKDTGMTGSAVTQLVKGLHIPGKALAALYTDGSGAPGAFLLVAKVKLSAQASVRELAGFKTGFLNSESNSGMTPTTFTAAPAGPLGGQMTCGTFQVRAITGTVCAFSDETSLGFVMLYSSNLESNATALQLRAAIETRS